MNDRTRRLRDLSTSTPPRICAQRALLMTEFFAQGSPSVEASVAVQRAAAFAHLCAHKTAHIGHGELIVGERGSEPMAVSTFPELTCHSLEDLQTLNQRAKTAYRVDDQVLEAYRDRVIPYWGERALRNRIFEAMGDDWLSAYRGGIFTEFMEQRAPGHTVADDKIYTIGLSGSLARIGAARKRFAQIPANGDRLEELRAMELAAGGVVTLATRYAAAARQQAARCSDPPRKRELEAIARVCERVPLHPPRNFHEALQSYWFCHLGVITELNGWDSFCPGHLDQHLEPFFKRGIAEGTLTRESARELLECFFIKFNNHPAPPKVGVTAAESGTYTDFCNINLGGVTPDGSTGVGEVSYLLLEVIDSLHILQPSQNVQIAANTPDAFLKEACRLIRKGYGFPSVFNSDQVVQEMLRVGKTLEDARAGGSSGCVETGAFGKEAYILTGYLNLPRILEITLGGGKCPRTGQQLGAATDRGDHIRDMDHLMRSFRVQLAHFVEIKMTGNRAIETIYATQMPAPFLSLLVDDCIANARDYNAGGARYNTSYLQGVGIGTVTDSLAAIDHVVFNGGRATMEGLQVALGVDFQGHDDLRRALALDAPKWGNDDDRADRYMTLVFDALFDLVDGRPSSFGTCHVAMLPTTSHVYFGQMTGATPDGRAAHTPLSEGISPVQGKDVNGPTAVLLSAAKMDHRRTGGTLLNMKFLPSVLDGEEGIHAMGALIRAYFDMGGHHIQFNVVDAETLRAAKENPDAHRDLIVRVAGYSDYFCDLSEALQDEIISRTAQG